MESMRRFGLRNATIPQVDPPLARIPTTAEIAEVLLLAHHNSPWTHEGRCRAILRRTLLHVRWTRSWHRADLEARRLVARARSQAGIMVRLGSKCLAWRMAAVLDLRQAVSGEAGHRLLLLQAMCLASKGHPRKSGDASALRQLQRSLRGRRQACPQADLFEGMSAHHR